MPWLHALPNLLQRINDADDELVALKGGCQWLTSDCGADAAAFLENEDGRVVCGTREARLAFSDAGGSVT